jgi:hypothetical protein
MTTFILSKEEFCLQGQYFFTISVNVVELENFNNCGLEDFSRRYLRCCTGMIHNLIDCGC